jgi:hypothetical protein
VSYFALTALLAGANNSWKNMAMRATALLMSLILLASCEDSPKPNRRDLLPGFVGKAGEVTVIMDDQFWNGRAGEVVKEFLATPVPGLPQYEPMFDFQRYSHADFDNLVKPSRNILFVDIRDNINYKDSKVQVIREQFAKDQIVVSCTAMSEDEFIEEFRKTAHTIAEKINEAERNRLIQYNLTFGNKDIGAYLTNSRGYSIDFYEQCSVTEEHKEFIWVHKITARPKDQQMHDVQQGILIYEYPYTDDSTFTKRFLLEKRDSILKKWLPGPESGSYMATETRFDEPQFKEFYHNEKYAVEIRGLWKMENAIMGGPFVSLTTYDEARGLIVTVEGFVFAPKFDKREYMREIEAVLRSFSYKRQNQKSN